MNTYHLTRLIAILSFLFSVNLWAEDETSSTPPIGQFSYFTLEPDITTNFYSKSKKLGYIQVRVDIVVANDSDLKIVEHHQPLIRNTIIDVLGKQTLESIRSLTGREELRKTLVTEINNALLPEVGKTVIADLLFTKYLYG